MDYDELTLSLLEKAENLKSEGRPEEAIKVLQKLLMDNPACVEAYEEIGDNYLELRDLDKSKNALMMALDMNQESANAHYLLGFLYSVEEKWQKSVKELEIADGLSFNHPEILRCLGWSLFNIDKREEGVAVLERARNLSPVDPNILCDLGMCYMNTFEVEKADLVLKAALKIDPTMPQALECMSMLNVYKEKEKISKISKKS